MEVMNEQRACITCHHQVSRTILRVRARDGRGHLPNQRASSVGEQMELLNHHQESWVQQSRDHGHSLLTRKSMSVMTRLHGGSGAQNILECHGHFCMLSAVIHLESCLPSPGEKENVVIGRCPCQSGRERQATLEREE